jgi:hypothetical protein
MKMKQKEALLNLQLSERMTEMEAVETFGYMTNQSRLRHTTEAQIQKQWRDKRLGSLLKRLDRERFDGMKPGK